MSQGEREQRLRELIAKLEKQGCYCDVRAGWSCPMHGYLHELEALLAEPQPGPIVTVTHGALPGCTADAIAQSGKWKTFEPPASPSLNIHLDVAKCPLHREHLQFCIVCAENMIDTPRPKREAELRDRVLEEAAQIAEECSSDETRDEKFRIAQTLRALKSQVSVKGQCHSLSACLCCYGTVRAHAAVKQHCQFCERPTSQVSVTGASHDK